MPTAKDREETHVIEGRAQRGGGSTYHLKGTSLNGYTIYRSVEAEDLEAAEADLRGQAAAEGEALETIEEVSKGEVDKGNAPEPQPEDLGPSGKPVTDTEGVSEEKAQEKERQTNEDNTRATRKT